MKDTSSGAIKLGIIVLVAIVVMALGFNFLKGSSVLSDNQTYLARYSNIEGLALSNPIVINGLQVGTVKRIEPESNVSSIIVTLDIKRNIQIPNNSIAIIVPNPLGNPKIEIQMGNSSSILKENDTLLTLVNKGIVDDVLDRVDPVVDQVKKVTVTLDTLLKNFNSTINNRVRNDIEVTMDNLQKLSNALLETGESFKKIMDAQNGTVNKSLKHIEHITANLDNQSDNINHIISQLDKATLKMSELDFQTTLKTIEHSLITLDTAIGKLNNNDGTAGLLLNDPTLYKNLVSTSRKINTLLDDVRLHPKRYMTVSLFGKKKNNEKPLTNPIEDSVVAPEKNR
jgi:phospholipid/cholesterol/gamma-HCH transport system substrate-binding protein